MAFGGQKDRRTDFKSPAGVEMDKSPCDVSGVWSSFAPCDTCMRFVYASMNTHKMLSPPLLDRAFAEYQKHIKSPSCKKFGKGRGHIGNGRHMGLWAFTLTKSPQDPLTVGDMLAAVRKVMRQKSCPVKSFAWYYEDKGRDENGDPIHPHIHGIYETDSGGRIECKHWVRAWKIWGENSKDPKERCMGAGFRGGYHREVKDGESYKDYIKKDGGMHEVHNLPDL